MTSFTDLGLIEPLLRAVAAEGYETPTPIQAHAIPHLVAGRDLLGIAQTGTGKTAAFTLPILQRLAAEKGRAAPGTARVLILTPTRELAVQIAESFATYGRHVRHKRTLVYGGVGQHPQVRSLAGGTDVLIATPGRLLDLMGQGHVRFGGVGTFVLDEADRMLDMGFIRDVRRIVATLPAKRQTLLFSATMPETIDSLAGEILRDPERVEVTPAATTVDRIEQRVMFVGRADKRRLLGRLLEDRAVGRAIVFARTKHGADRIAEQLRRDGEKADAIHGNKSQNARQRALADFRSGRIRTLVATDIAARGIDVDDVTHVINFDLPHEPESYVHRIGRTARAGAEGVSWSFCDAEELSNLRAIEKAIRRPIEVETDHPFHAEAVARASAARARPAPAPAPAQRRNRRGGRRPARAA